MPFHELQQPTALLWKRTKRLNLLSAEGKLLQTRHSEGELGSASPFDQLMGADYFLFLRGEVDNDHQQQVLWFPVTAVYFQQGATFLERLHRNDFAMRVATALGLPGTDELRNLVKSTVAKISRAYGISWNGFEEATSPNLIGSR
jgi:hypothetical protein